MLMGCASQSKDARLGGSGVLDGEMRSGSPVAAQSDESAVPRSAVGSSARTATPAPADSGRFEPLCTGAVFDCDGYARVEEALVAGDYDEAERTLSQLRGRLGELGPSTNERALQSLFRGWLLLETGSLSYGAGGEAARSALLEFDSAIRLLGDDPGGEAAAVFNRLSLQKARAQLALGQGEGALAALQRLGEAFRGEAEVQAAWGIARLSVGNIPESLAPLRRAARLDPNEPERHVVLGTAQMLAGQYAEAERSYRQALALRPDEARIHSDLGALLLLMGRIAEGKTHLERAAQLSPAEATFWANLAYAELLSEQPTRCEERARRALELDDQLASAWLNLGLCLVALGNNDSARASFVKAAELDPTDPRAQNNLRDLDELDAQQAR